MATGDASLKSKKSNPVIMVVILLVFGLIPGGVGLYKYNMGKESISWPIVKGKVTLSRAIPKTVKNSHEYQLSVTYTYTVDGRAYTGKRITASDAYQKTLSNAKNILKKYPVGGEVSIYYSPADPGVSVLETGIKKNIKVLFWIAAICFLLATAIIISELKKKRSA